MEIIRHSSMQDHMQDIKRHVSVLDYRSRSLNDRIDDICSLHPIVSMGLDSFLEEHQIAAILKERFGNDDGARYAARLFKRIEEKLNDCIRFTITEPELWHRYD